MPPAGTMESEIKLEAEMAFTVPDLRDLVEGTVRLPEENLSTTYFDTSDLRLWQRKISLRYRSGEQSRPGSWTIKVPQGGPGRTLDRRELTWPGSAQTIPEAAVRILRGLIRRSPLVEIAHIETLRRRLVLQGGRDLTLGELDDDTVTIHGGPNDGQRFRQIEFEVEADDVKLVERVLDRLRAAGARPDRAGPKLARALGHEPVDAEAALGPKSSTEEVIRVTISGALDRILDHEYLIRINEADPPAHDVHQTRVASRRLRSDLKTFGVALDSVWVRHVRGDLKWLGRALGAVRDIDVLALELDDRRATGSVDLQGYGPIILDLREQRQPVAKDLVKVLDSDRYILLLDKLHSAAQRPPLVRERPTGQGSAQTRAAEALPRLIRRPWKKLRRQVKQAGSCPSDRQLHRIRIRSKQLRYACEAASAVIGKPARKMAKAAESLQTELGEHHDAVEVQRWLREEARRGPGSLAFSAGQLTGQEQVRQAKARRRWRGHWRRLNRKAIRNWLT